MLTKEEEEHIRHEEIFRQEVREMLEKNKRPQSIRGKIWSVLNASFGIWLLSTIVVGLFSWAYTNWEQRRTKQRDQNELVRKLDIEIPSRLQKSESLFNGAFRAFSYYNAMRSLRKPDDVVVFPEFQERPLTSLMWELLQQVPSEEKAEVNEALNNLQKLSNVDYQSKLGNMPGDAPLTPAMQADVEDAQKSLSQIRNLKRWQKPN